MAKEPMARGRDKQGCGVWLIQVNTGVCIDGKYQRISETFHGTKKEAKARQREIENDLAAGIDANAGKIGFTQYANAWLDGKAVSVAPRTLDGYRREVKKLSGILGNTPMQKITAPVVRAALQSVREGINGRDGGTASENTVYKAYRVLHMILGQAVKDDICRCNACDKVDTPRCKARERRSLTFEQYADMLREIDKSARAAYSAYEAKEEHLRETGHQNKQRAEIRGIRDAANVCFVRIAHATGMRPSEILALQWQHVDFANGCIHVKQATAGDSGGIKATKSSSGIRDIYLNAHTLEALAEWRRFQSSAANKLGIELGLTSWVICTDAFTQVDLCNMRNWWLRWSEAAGFAGWQIYELRHTQATLLINAGANLQAVKAQMGHSSIAVTQVYTHTNEETQKKLADLLPTA